MANILMTVWPIETHLTPFVVLGKALRARGHDVAFYTGEQARWQLSGEGFRTFEFRAVDKRHSDANPGAASSQNLGPRATRKMWHDFLLGSVSGQIRDLDAIWEEWVPDALICDVTMWGPILVVQETRQVPLALFAHTAYCLLPGRNNPAPGLSLPRPETGRARLTARLLTWGMNRVTAAIPREANRIRREHGLEPFAGTVIDFMGRMPLHLVPSAPEFDYERDDLPGGVKYVGPGFWEEHGREPAPHWTKWLRTSRPRVVVLEEAHYAEDGFLLHRAAEALAGHDAEVILVAGQGRELSQFNLKTHAANVHLMGWTPLRQALPPASLVVAHGNSETVLAALAQGTPMVIVPRMLEQPQVAWRLAACGAGVRLPMRECSPQRLRAAVDRVLETPRFAHNAQRMRAALAQRGGPARAAELVEEMAPALPINLKTYSA